MSDDTDDNLPAARETFVPRDKGYTHCPSCQNVMKPFYAKCPKCEGERNRRKGDELARVIRDLKSSVDSPIPSDREAALVKQLHEYGHPDVDGFLRALQERRDSPAQKKSARRSFG